MSDFEVRYPGPSNGVVAWRGGKHPEFRHVPSWCVPYLGAFGPYWGFQHPFRTQYPRWLWILDGHAFHPYADVDGYAASGSDDDVAAVATEIERELLRLEIVLATLASRMFEVRPSQLAMDRMVSNATRSLPDGRMKLSIHVVFRIRHGLNFLLLPKRVMKELVLSCEPKHLDPAPYHEGMQLFRALGCAGSGLDETARHSVLRPVISPLGWVLMCRWREMGLPVKPLFEAYFFIVEYRWHYPGWCEHERFSAPVFTMEEYMEKGKVQLTLRSTPLQRVLAPVAVARERQLLDFVRDRYRQVLPREESMLDAIPETNRERLLFNFEDIPMVRKFRVVFPRSLFARAAGHLPRGAIRGPGSGTYDVYFLWLQAAVAENARDDWVRFCRDHVPLSRCREPLAAFDEQRVRVDGLRAQGRPVRGIRSLLQFLQTTYGVDIPVEDEGPEDGEMICCTTNVEVWACPLGNRTWSVSRVCMDCRRVRGLGQIHPDLKYPDPQWVKVPNVCDVLYRIKQSLQQVHYNADAGEFVRQKIALFAVVPCGMGKTQAAVQYVRSNTQPGKLVVIPLITCALVNFWKQSLDEALDGRPIRVSVVHSNAPKEGLGWLNPSGDYPIPSVVVVTPESLWRVWRVIEARRDEITSYAVILDEASKVLQHFNSETMRNRLVLRADSFAKMLQGAREILLLDADISLWTIHAASLLFPAHHVTTLLNTEAKRAGRIAYVCHKQTDFVGRLLHDVYNHEHGVFLVYSTSKRFVDQLAVHLVDVVPEDVTVQLFTSENAVPEDFVEHAFEQEGRTIYLFSPVMSAGVSLVPPVGSNALAYIHTADTKFLIAIQQSQRLRSTTPLVVFCPDIRLHRPSCRLEDTTYQKIFEALKENRAVSNHYLMPDELLVLMVEYIGNQKWAEFFPLFFIMYGLLVREGLTPQTLPAVPDRFVDMATLGDGKPDIAEAVEQDIDYAVPFCLSTAVMQGVEMQSTKDRFIAFCLGNNFTRFLLCCLYPDDARFDFRLIRTDGYYGNTLPSQVFGFLEYLLNNLGFQGGVRSAYQWNGNEWLAPGELRAMAREAVGDSASIEFLRRTVDALQECGLSQVSYAYRTLVETLLKLARLPEGEAVKRRTRNDFLRCVMAVYGLPVFVRGKNVSLASYRRFFLSVVFDFPDGVLYSDEKELAVGTTYEDLSSAAQKRYSLLPPYFTSRYDCTELPGWANAWEILSTES